MQFYYLLNRGRKYARERLEILQYISVHSNIFSINLVRYMIFFLEKYKTF